jgi:hypothetical protein
MSAGRRSVMSGGLQCAVADSKVPVYRKLPEKGKASENF